MASTLQSKGDVCLFDGQPSTTDIAGNDNALTELQGKICIILARMLASLQTHLCLCRYKRASPMVSPLT